MTDSPLVNARPETLECGTLTRKVDSESLDDRA